MRLAFTAWDVNSPGSGGWKQWWLEAVVAGSSGGWKQWWLEAVVTPGKYSSRTNEVNDHHD